MANIPQIKIGSTTFNIKDIIAQRSISSFIGFHQSFDVVFNYGTKVINIPAGFAVYKGRASARSAQTIDLTSYLTLNEACTLWMTSAGSIYPKAWNTAPNSDNDEFLGYVFEKIVWVSGVPNEHIKIVDTNGSRMATSDISSGSFIGIEAELRKVVYNVTNNTLTLPGGFKSYRGNTSAYNEETIQLTANATAMKLWMKNDKTIYSTAWNSNTREALDDDCIGFIYSGTVCIAGVPDYCISVVGNGKERNGLVFGDAYIGINFYSEIVYDTNAMTFTIPAGFSIYRGIGATRSAAVVVDASDFPQDAGVLFMKSTREIYARGWSSGLFERPDDEIVGVFWGANVWINGVDQKQISIVKGTSGVYCFGDSITAGTNTVKAFHMFLHNWKNDAVLYNYGVGSTGFVCETSDTVVVGGGVVGIGSAVKENGDNSIKKVMESVTETMPNIIIAAGTNDFGTNQTLTDFRTAVQDALDYALEQTPHVLVITPLKREGWETTRNTQNLLLKDYSDVIIEECEARGIVYVDGYEVGINPTYADNKTAFAPDGLHPNAHGHERMARSIWNKYLEAIHIDDEY